MHAVFTPLRIYYCRTYIIRGVPQLGLAFLSWNTVWLKGYRVVLEVQTIGFNGQIRFSTDEAHVLFVCVRGRIGS